MGSGKWFFNAHRFWENDDSMNQMENGRTAKPSDQDLFDSLKQGDDSAWEYVMEHVVLPVVKNGQTRHGIPFRVILSDRFIESRDVLNDLYILMIKQGKLENYGFRASLVTWMRWYVIKIIMGYCDKKMLTMSEMEAEPVYENEDTSRDERLEALQKSFKELWEANPMKAYVLLLKNQNCYSSTEIMNYLGLSSEDNVDQLFCRAKEDIRKLIKKHSGEEP